MLTVISVFALLGVFCIDLLNYSIKVSVERWPHCYV